MGGRRTNLGKVFFVIILGKCCCGCVVNVFVIRYQELEGTVSSEKVYLANLEAYKVYRFNIQKEVSERREERG